MDFNKHFNLTGKHAFLSASNFHWVNYSPERLQQVYLNMKKKEEGTLLHNFASSAIVNRIKLAPHKKALNMFVNDAIGFNMESEQVLYYSDNCFGTADAILFKDGILKIHDLKTGISKPSFKQLDVYAALFCLEYGVDPHEIVIEECIYQGREIDFYSPPAEDIAYIMEKIINFDTLLNTMKENPL